VWPSEKCAGWKNTKALECCVVSTFSVLFIRSFSVRHSSAVLVQP